MFRWLRKLFQRSITGPRQGGGNRPHYEARPGRLKVVGGDFVGLHTT